MSKCDHAERFRRCRFEQRKSSRETLAIEAYIPANIIRLAGNYAIDGQEGIWRLQAMEADYLCETALRAKAKKHPRLYQTAEVRPE